MVYNDGWDWFYNAEHCWKWAAVHFPTTGNYSTVSFGREMKEYRILIHSHVSLGPLYVSSKWYSAAVEGFPHLLVCELLLLTLACRSLFSFRRSWENWTNKRINNERDQHYLSNNSNENQQSMTVRASQPKTSTNAKSRASQSPTEGGNYDTQQ